jgi:hypothetical protein
MAYTSAFIDGYTVITAKSGWAARPDLTGIDQLTAPITPTHGGPSVRPLVASFESPDGTPIDEVLMHPQLDRVVVRTLGNPATGQPGGINVCLGDGSVRFVRSGANVQGMVFSRHLELFVLEQNSVVRYRENAAGGWSEMSRRSFAQGFDAIAYDDSTDEVVCVDGAGGVMARFDQDLANLPVEEMLPPGVRPEGPISIALSPGGVARPGWESKYILKGGLAGELFHIERVAAAGARTREHVLLARQAFPELRHASGGGGGTGKVSYSDLSVMTKVLVPAGGIIREYTRTATGFEPTSTSRFAGLPAGPFVDFSQSRTNFDPALHSGPGWENVLPTEFAPVVSSCPMDLNQNGVVDFGDITAVLANYASGSLMGDLGDADLDADVDFSDITTVLANFNRICD